MTNYVLKLSQTILPTLKSFKKLVNEGNVNSLNIFKL